MVAGFSRFPSNIKNHVTPIRFFLFMSRAVSGENNWWVHVSLGGRLVRFPMTDTTHLHKTETPGSFFFSKYVFSNFVNMMKEPFCVIRCKNAIRYGGSVVLYTAFTVYTVYHISPRKRSTSKVVYCQFFFRNPCNTKYTTQAKKRNILTPGAPKWVKDTGNELK